MNLSAWAEKRFRSSVIVRNRDIVVKLDGAGLPIIADSYVASVESAYRSTKMANEINGEDLLSYFKTLMWLRVAQVNSNRLDGYDVRAYSVPAFIGVLLVNINKVHDDEHGFNLIPHMDKPEGMMSHGRMCEMSRLIRSLRNAFFPVDFPLKSVGGSVEFMSKVVIENVVHSYRPHDAQVFAYLASITNHMLVEETARQHFFVSYGDNNFYHRDTPMDEVDFDEVGVVQNE